MKMEIDLMGTCCTQMVEFFVEMAEESPWDLATVCISRLSLLLSFVMLGFGWKVGSLSRITFFKPFSQSLQTVPFSLMLQPRFAAAGAAPPRSVVQVSQLSRF